MMNICYACRHPIPAIDEVWVEVLVCRRTHSSPEEYSEEPMHRACRDRAEFDDDPHERASARARNNDFADTGGRDWT